MNAASSYARGAATVLGYEWSFPNRADIGTHEPTFEHSFEKAGEYRVKVTVVDSNLKRSTKELPISVSATPPIHDQKLAAVAVERRDSEKVNGKRRTTIQLAPRKDKALGYVVKLNGVVAGSFPEKDHKIVIVDDMSTNTEVEVFALDADGRTSDSWSFGMPKA